MEILTPDGRIDFHVDANRSKARLIVESKGQFSSLSLSTEQAQQFAESMLSKLKNKDGIMSIKQAILSIDEDVLEKALEFAAHVFNNQEAVTSAAEEQGVSMAEGYTLARLFAELGLTGETSITTAAELESETARIKEAMGL